MDRQALEQFIAAYSADVKRRRKELGYSHETLADKAGVTRQAISKIEAGESDLRLTTMLRIAAAFDLRLSDMMLPVEAEANIYDEKG